jgi:hypothetical protein
MGRWRTHPADRPEFLPTLGKISTHRLQRKQWPVGPLPDGDP